ncbi:rubredoxin [Archangium primigenium]|uniref:rubredoxin n=1 Tax=[Archangium] primigenium TaxID=2792470 RepID=UPI001957EBFD|nr:rubredoxin [Archangium primigenium]
MALTKYRCLPCNHIYDPAEGDPTSGIPAGTAFADLPEDWICPDCGASKADFEPMEE